MPIVNCVGAVCGVGERAAERDSSLERAETAERERERGDGQRERERERSMPHLLEPGTVLGVLMRCRSKMLFNVSERLNNNGMLR